MMSIPTAATTSWPDAALGISGVALFGAIAVVVIWQGLSTWRARIAVTRERAFQTLMEQTAGELSELNRRLTELERARPVGADVPVAAEERSS